MPTRIILGVPSGGSPAPPFIQSLGALKLPLSVARLERSFAFGNYVPAQRELIMQDAVNGDFDYLFFVDDDMVLPERALEMLLATAEADPSTAVVGALYYSRDSVRPVTVADWNSSDTAAAHIPGFTSKTTDIVDGVGFGCALLRVSAAKAIGAPYFPAHVYIEQTTRFVRICDEDYLYCERARHAGFTVRLDARIRCPHYDRGSETIAPVAWESDDTTAEPRMIISQDGAVRLVPLDESTPRAPERHTRAELTYITVA